ncbi:MAG: Hsp20/alpha crystallin family protein [Chloroflexi bacterium]|nr:Hsp20/alpha crystallin family protein [Chloroflexota bacterium]
MSMIRWEPFRDLMTLREAMNRLFEESYVRPGARWARTEERQCDLPIDAYVTDEELVITAPVPGMSPEDVEITIEGDTLTIRGEIKGPLDNVNYLIQERQCGRFQRTLRLNIPVQADKAEATFENGVLTLVIPKQEEVKPKTVKVKTK